MNKETIEGVKLISIFMGGIGMFKNNSGQWRCSFSDNPSDHFILPEYDKDWNELIPVVKKIKDYLQSLPRPTRNHCCKGDLLEVDIQCALWELDIKMVFDNIIPFIEWYNTQLGKTSIVNTNKSSQ